VQTDGVMLDHIYKHLVDCPSSLVTDWLAVSYLGQLRAYCGRSRARWFLLPILDTAHVIYTMFYPWRDQASKAR